MFSDSFLFVVSARGNIFLRKILYHSNVSITFVRFLRLYAKKAFGMHDRRQTDTHSRRMGFRTRKANGLASATVRFVGLALFLLVSSGDAYGDISERLFHLEIGLEGGCGYYAGDAELYIFQDIREAYGGGVRYSIDRRWSVRVKGMAQRISGYNPNAAGRADRRMTIWTNQLVNIDAVGEFNFLPYGRIRYDKRVSPLTPYIATGLGVGLHNKWSKVGVYVPFIVGLKWQPLPQMAVHVAWQHNVYFADNLETVPEYDNRYDLNGSNILNCDVTGQLVAGIAFLFLQDKLVCRTCK